MENKHTHTVVNTKTGATVGKYTSAKSAHRAADKADEKYGATVHSVKPIAEGIGSAIKNVFKRKTAVEKFRELSAKRTRDNLGAPEERVPKPHAPSRSRSEYDANRAMGRRSNIGESEASNKIYSEADKHLSLANDEERENGKTQKFHFHMADYHDAMSEWNSERGREGVADKHARKADMHQEKAVMMKEETEYKVGDKVSIHSPDDWDWHERKGKLVSTSDDGHVVKLDGGIMLSVAKHEIKKLDEEKQLDHEGANARRVAAMPKGSILGSTDDIKTHLKYLEARFKHLKKFGYSTNKVADKIGRVNHLLTQKRTIPEEVKVGQQVKFKEPVSGKTRGSRKPMTFHGGEVVQVKSDGAIVRPKAWHGDEGLDVHVPHKNIHEGSHVNCPECGEDYGKASEYGSNHLKYCANCGYRANNSDKEAARAELDRDSNDNSNPFANYWKKLNENSASERIKRKYRGTKRGTNETGSPAHRINTKPSVDDNHGTGMGASRYLRRTRHSADD